tara:strand:+ start:1977 stop:3614 length:1638 start_codon:yes stop_codon:yes gene_type:complete
MSNINVNTITPLTGVTGTVGISGSLLVSGSITANGNIILGDGTSDSVSFGAEISSSMIPDQDDKYHLGSTAKQWKNVYIDGIGYIDTLTSDNITNVNTTHVTASGNISSSATVSAEHLYSSDDAVITDTLTVGTITNVSTTHVTASGNLKVAGTIVSTGNINSAALITAEHLTSTDDATIQDTLTVGTIANVNTANVTASSNMSASGTVTANAFIGTLTGTSTGLAGTPTIIVGNVTASNVSASGTISATSMISTLTGTSTGLAGTPSIVVTHITASNITSSGTITAEHFYSTDDAQIQDLLTVGRITSNGTSILGNSSNDMHIFTGNVTASSNISSSLASTASFGRVEGTTISATTLIGQVNQVIKVGDSLTPVLNNHKNLGSSNLQWKDLYVDGTAYLDTQDNVNTTNVTASGTITASQYTTNNVTIGASNITAGSLTLDKDVKSAVATDTAFYILNGKRGEIRSQLQAGVAVDTGWNIELRNTDIAANSLIVANVIGGAGSIVSASVLTANTIGVSTASFNFFNTGIALIDNAAFTASFAVL